MAIGFYLERIKCYKVNYSDGYKLKTDWGVGTEKWEVKDKTHIAKCLRFSHLLRSIFIL